jgi:transcriptional regulator with XRE-family HTH domain
LIIRNDFEGCQWVLVDYNKQMARSPSRRPRKTPIDPELRIAIAAGLKEYRDRELVKDSEVARRLGMGKSTFSKYMNGKELMGGAALTRAMELGVTVKYRGKEFSASVDSDGRRPPLEEATPPAAEQISFVFDQPCLLEETPATMSVMIGRKQVQRLGVTVHVRVAS